MPILKFISNIKAIQVLDIIFAICIVILFRIFSSGLAYIIIRMFKVKAKNKKVITESAFYNPLKIFFNMLGIYIAVICLKRPLSISNEVMIWFTKVFEIVTVIVVSKGVAASFMPRSTLVKKMRERTIKNVEDSMLNFLLKIIRAVIYVVAGFIVITLLGVNLNGLVAGLGLGGVIVTLAAQDTAKNLFGGLVIFLDKPFIVGDWIEMTPYEGTVEDITFRSTRIRTFENSLVNIPNSVISNSAITNWSKMEKRRYKIHLCIHLDTPQEKLDKFMARVREMLQQRDAIFDETIMVKFEAIVDNGMNVLISSYTNSVDYASYISEVENINIKIMKILREENIELAYDTKTIYVNH